MRFRCAYNRKDAVAAQGSSSRSVLSGVSVGAGGLWSCVVLEGLDVEECDLCLEACPEDMLRQAMFDESVSPRPALWSWPYCWPRGRWEGRLPNLDEAMAEYETLCVAER